tara:strand:- start:435 stop:1163 length:729 start_codon:yes stop_codon:yes gene_type:complete
MLKRFLINACLSFALFLTCLMLSWFVCSQNNFLFGQLYEYNQLEEHIEKYAPQNRNRGNFETTTKEERVRVFGQIVHAINNNGFGLEDIVYRTDSGDIIDKFLTKEEVDHLNDVSGLIKILNKLNIYLIVILAVLILFCWIYKVRKAKYFWKPVSLLAAFLNMVVLVAIGCSAVFAVGPQNVFYILHEWFFADKAQWHFYFQDSLMTTLLPEPIFGSIAILLVTVAFLFWIILSNVIIKVLR